MDSGGEGFVFGPGPRVFSWQAPALCAVLPHWLVVQGSCLQPSVPAVSGFSRTRLLQ